MSKTKIKRDSHGLYIRGAGYIWRPDYPVGYSHVHGPTAFKEGDEVSVSHSGGPLASINRSGDRERWYSHGSYYPTSSLPPRPLPGRKRLTSEQCYRPDYTIWE